MTLLFEQLMLSLEPENCLRACMSGYSSLLTGDGSSGTQNKLDFVMSGQVGQACRTGQVHGDFRINYFA